MRIIAFLLIWLMPAATLANDWDALRQPGAIGIMRHALAPGTGDPAEFDVTDCSTQRNLDDRGQAQARAIGDALRANGFGFDTVYTSQWCRCRETAELLGFGEPQEVPSLNSFFADRSTRDAQTRETRALISAADGPVLLVTHQVNISALTGQFTSSGEMLVIRDTPDGIEVLGAIEIAP